MPWRRWVSATAMLERWAWISPSLCKYANPTTSAPSRATTAVTPGAVRTRCARCGSAGNDGQPSATQSASTPSRSARS